MYDPLKNFDPAQEFLPSRIKSNKTHCSKCHAPITDIGTCPYCGTEEMPLYYNKIPCHPQDIIFIETIIKPKYGLNEVKKKYEIVKTEGFDKKKTIAFKKADHSFFRQFTTIIFNFDVEIHRLQGGLVKHQTYPRLNMELNETEKVIINGKGRPLYKIEKTNPCECGCKINVIDRYHGQVLCPVCGNVHSKLFLNEKEEIL